MSLPERQIKPGEHVVYIASNADATAFQARLEGLEVRDCFSIQLPQGSTIGILLRLPFEDTILNQVLRKGTGVLNIDRSRVSVDPEEVIEQKSGIVTVGSSHEGYKRPGRSMYTHSPKERNGPANSSGRFPTNFILIHGADCEHVGTKKVQASGGIWTDEMKGSRPGGFVDIGASKGSKKPSGTCHYNEDGTEEVPDWNCQPDCPVRLLDLQSGERPSTLARLDIKGKVSNPAKKSKEGGIYGNYNKGAISDHGEVYGDTGGASRFFYQTTSMDGLQNYLDTLTGKL